MDTAKLASFESLTDNDLSTVVGGEMVSRSALYLKSSKQLGQFGKGFAQGIWDTLGWW